MSRELIFAGLVLETLLFAVMLTEGWRFALGMAVALPLMGAVLALAVWGLWGLAGLLA
jgi:hypothetical protein